MYKWYWGQNSKTSLVVWNWNSWSCEHILGHPCSRQKISVNSQSTKILLQNILRFAPIVFLATNSSPKPYITICKLTLNSREGRQLKKRKKRNFELNILVFQPSPIVKSLGGEFITQHKIYTCVVGNHRDYKNQFCCEQSTCDVGLLYGLFGSTEREESRGEWVVRRRVEGNDYPPHCLDVFKISKWEWSN